MDSIGKPGGDSKIAHAYDAAIAQAQNDMEKLEAAHEKREDGVESSEVGPVIILGGVAPNLPDAFTGEEDELRGREFPVPAGATDSLSRRLVIDPNTVPQNEVTNGRRTGQVAGDSPRAGDVPSIMEQDVLAPDLESEQR